MKNHIIINYSRISNIKDSIGKYKSALETMEASLKSIKDVLETENSGESITALIEEYEEIQNYINSCKLELKDLYDIFSEYYYDMMSIIKPNNELNHIYLDKEDIYYKLQSILDSVQEIKKIQREDFYEKTFQAPDNFYGFMPTLNGDTSRYEQEKNEELNYNKIEDIKSEIGQRARRIENHYELLEHGFRKKIVSYIDMDERHASRAKSIYNKNISSSQKATSSLMNYGGAHKNLGDLLKESYESMKALAQGGSMYALGVVTINQETKTDRSVKTDNQNGIGYCVGYSLV